MVLPIAAEAPVRAATSVTDYRVRTAVAEKPIQANSAPPADPSAQLTNSRSGQQDNSAPEQPMRPASTMFAAAVIAGSLPPRPETLEELFLRIGTSPIPAEFEGRLKNLLA